MPGDRVMTLGILLARAAVAVQTAAHLVNEFALNGEISNLDADAESATFAWAGSVATFAAGLGAMLLGTVERAPRLSYAVSR